MGEKALDTFDLETYLEMEASSVEKYEYYDGYIHAMAGGSTEHGEIAGNVIASLKAALKGAGKSCKVYTSDVKIAIQRSNRRFYPDASVVCGPPERDEREPNAITNPVLVAEVLFEGTESLDRGEKFVAYRQLPSLREYLLINQYKVQVEVFSRNEDGNWRIQTLTDLSQQIELPALGIVLSTADIYDGVDGLQAASATLT